MTHPLVLFLIGIIIAVVVCIISNAKDRLLRAGQISQILVMIAALVGVFYIVLPTYQLKKVSEELAENEFKLIESNKELSDVKIKIEENKKFFEDTRYKLNVQYFREFITMLKFNFNNFAEMEITNEKDSSRGIDNLITLTRVKTNYLTNFAPYHILKDAINTLYTGEAKYPGITFMPDSLIMRFKQRTLFLVEKYKDSLKTDVDFFVLGEKFNQENRELTKKINKDNEDVIEDLRTKLLLKLTKEINEIRFKEEIKFNIVQKENPHYFIKD